MSNESHLTKEQQAEIAELEGKINKDKDAVARQYEPVRETGMMLGLDGDVEILAMQEALDVARRDLTLDKNSRDKIGFIPMRAHEGMGDKESLKTALKEKLCAIGRLDEVLDKEGYYMQEAVRMIKNDKEKVSEMESKQRMAGKEARERLPETESELVNTKEESLSRASHIETIRYARQLAKEGEEMDSL